VYAVLTGAVLLVLVVVVAGLTRLLPDGPLPQVVAAALVAVGLTPARDGIQRVIDRLLYGVRDDPMGALQRVGSPLRSTEGHELVTEILAALARALKVDGVAITGARAATYGELTGDLTEVPLEFAGEVVGTLHVSPRRGERRLGAADERTLSAVAPLVAAVVRSVALADDLRAEKERVVEATQLERHRLRQELHDGLGPSLTGIGLGLEAVVPQRPQDQQLLGRLRAEVTSALEEIRRIIDDLRPFALDDDDLASVLRRRTGQIAEATGMSVQFDSPRDLPFLPPEVSAAALRIAEEALTNVVRHADASVCRVRLRVDDCLHLEVSDNGSGRRDADTPGVGLASMRERAERIGGRFTLADAAPGTTVLAALPLQAPA
jgi:signal transduction histidine kinase